MPVINLKKGSGVSLKKEHPALKKIHVGLGWDTISDTVDLDVSAFALDLSSGKPPLTNESNFVFYNNLSTKDGSIKHMGDNRTGDGDGDDEVILVDLDKVTSDVGEIAFIVTIYNENTINTFKDVSNAFIRIVNDDTKVEIARYSLNENFGGNLAVQFGSIIRNGKDWDFTAVGTGYNVGLEEILAQYGLKI